MLKILKNEKGVGIILMVLAVFILITIFIGTAAVHFQSLYAEIARQQRSLAAHQVLQDFAAMAGRAREVFLNVGAACTPTTQLDGPNQLCWPRPIGTSHCVPHPLGNMNPAVPRWICRVAAPPGPGAAPGVMDVVMQAEPANYTTAQMLNFRFNSLRSDFSVGLDILSSKLQNLAFANSDTSFHPTDLVAAGSVSFAAVIACPAVVPAALEPYCKRCPGVGGSNMGQCFRLRVCLRSTPCTWGNNTEWETQTIGLINRS